jgi:mono/diheme cytochrome c family protein
VIPWILIATAAWAAWPATAGAADLDLYRRHCAVCHGPEGRGDGPAAGLLSPRPRDFTTGIYKFRSTPSGSLPVVADLVRTLQSGLPGTSMPSYEGLLSAQEMERLSHLVLSLAPAQSRRAAPVTLGVPPPPSPGALLRGKALYERMGCRGCHDADGRPRGGRPGVEGPGLPSFAPDLAEPWTFRGGGDAESIARRLLTGIDGSAMPSFASSLRPADAWGVAQYVVSLARAPAWGERDAGRVRTAGVQVDPLERGRYLANAMLCPLCHTPISPATGAYLTDRFLAGGMRVSAYPWGVWYSRNLTPDALTGLGAWSEQDIVIAVTRGITPDGRRLDPFAMPWTWFSRLTEADARAIAVYLKSLPRIANAVPARERIWPVEAVGGKLLVLLGSDAAVEFWGGNAATEPALRGRVPASWGRRLTAQALGWGTLLSVCGVLAIGLRRRGRRWRWLGLGAAALMGWIALAVWPPLALMSPEMTTRWLFLGAPSLPAGLEGSARALAERGAYVATIAPCGLCHTPAASFIGFDTRRTLAGGMEARWRVYGSAVSSNLTPHPGSGIARVPDAVLLRAMRSGIGRDGRPLHWQAMPWDIGSHWSEEDQRALLAYLRGLPPVPGTMPPARGPRFDDPAADSFYFGDAARR